MTIPAKPGQPIQNLMLAEGQAQEGIEVLQIDETAGVVRVKNQGIEQTLDFLNNGAKPVSGPAPTFQVPAPIPAQPMPSGGAPQFNPGSGRPQLPSRNLRMPGAANQSSMRSATPMNVNGNAPGQSQPSLSPEEQAVLIEAQRLRYRQQGNPIANILPPTEMTPELAPQ
jgi:hypothetical protein